MKKFIVLLFFVTISFIYYQNASAYSITAVPQKQEFEPNEWIKINLHIQGYDGGDIKWIAHKPDNSVISGIVDKQVRSEKTIHQIIRDAYDNEYGPWSINYSYKNTNQTVHFKVKSLNFLVFMDKSTYYESSIMNINITSAYFNPQAKFAESYLLDFYDKYGNLAIGNREIELKADRSSVLYHFPVLELAKYNPPGLYKLRIQYFNSQIYIPFLLGDIHKLMEITVNNAPTFYKGDNISFDLIFSRIVKDAATIKITDPLGNVTTKKFYPKSTHDSLTVNDVSSHIGTYNFEIKYAGTKSSGTFKVVTNTRELPKINLDLYLNKFSYRKGEIIEAKVFTSEIISNKISSWIVDPQGKARNSIVFSVSKNDMIIPYKISNDFQVGNWKYYVNYGGIVRASSFYVSPETLEYAEWINSKQTDIPNPSNIVSDTNSPSGISIDSEGNIYATDTTDSKVRKFDSTGNLLFEIGSLGSSNGQFRHPTGIFASNKYLYVADTGNSRIQIFDKNGKFVHMWGKYGEGQGMFYAPAYINSDKLGDLFVVDTKRNVIQIFDMFGNFKDEIKIGLEGGNVPISTIAFDSKNNFYVISSTKKVLEYSGKGDFKNTYGSIGTENDRFVQPNAIAIDSNGYFYVADSGKHSILKFDSKGNFISIWNPDLDQNNYTPVSIATDGNDNIYVGDTYHRVIQKFVSEKSESISLPVWIKKNSLWWSEGILDKSDFVPVIKYLIKQGLVEAHIPQQPIVSDSAIQDNLKKEMQSYSKGEVNHISPLDNSVNIPDWMKKVTYLWSTNEIDNDTFFATLKHLIESGIIRV